MSMVILKLIQLKDWDSHQSRFHGHVGRRFRERSVIANPSPSEGKERKKLKKRIHCKVFSILLTRYDILCSVTCILKSCIMITLVALKNYE